MNAFLTGVFDKRRARVVMCVCVAAALLLGGFRSLNGRRAAALDLYDNGQYTQGQGIPHDIDVCLSAYANTITVAKRYLSADDADMTRLSDSMDALSAANAPGAIHAANEVCYLAFIALHDRLGAASLTVEDARYRNTLYDNVKSARNRLSLSPYNAAANTYNDARASFPGILYATVFLMPPLEPYR